MSWAAPPRRALQTGQPGRACAPGAQSISSLPAGTGPCKPGWGSCTLRPIYETAEGMLWATCLWAGLESNKPDTQALTCGHTRGMCAQGRPDPEHLPCPCDPEAPVLSAPGRHLGIRMPPDAHAPLPAAGGNHPVRIARVQICSPADGHAPRGLWGPVPHCGGGREETKAAAHGPFNLEKGWQAGRRHCARSGKRAVPGRRDYEPTEGRHEGKRGQAGVVARTQLFVAERPEFRSTLPFFRCVCSGTRHRGWLQSPRL